MSLVLNNQINNNLTILPNICRNSKILQSRYELNNNNDMSSNYFDKRMKKTKSLIFKIKNNNNNFNINKSIINLRNNRKKSIYAKATFNLNSENNKLIILEKSNKNDDYTHNIKISNLLSNTKDFFNNLENHLKLSKDNANKKIIYKKISSDKTKDKSYPKTGKNKENGIDKLYGRMYNMKILNDEAKNDKNMSLTMKKSISTYNNENQNLNYYNVNSKNKITSKKSFNNQIVQTFNSMDNNENNNSTEQKNNNNNNENNNSTEQKNNNKNTDQQNTEYINLINSNILPNVKSNKYKYNYNEEPDDKNNIKIAEIKEVFPCYPSNRLLKIIHNNKTNINNNKQNQFKNYLSDLKNHYSRDSRYYYEKLMNAIKYDLGDIFCNKRKINPNNSLKSIFI